MISPASLNTPKQSSKDSYVIINNENLEKMDMDYLYHLGLTKLDADIFKDI